MFYHQQIDKEYKEMNFFFNLIIYFILILNICSCTGGIEKQFKNYIKKYKDKTILVSYGDNWVYTVFPANSWKYDQNKAIKGKLSIYLTPNNTNSSKVFIYGTALNNISTIISNKNLTPHDFVLFDIELFRKESPGLIVMNRPTKLDFKGINNIYEYKLKNHFGSFRQITYLELSHVVIVIAYSAINEKLYNIYLNDYLNLIKTFKYWGNNPDKLLKGYSGYKKGYNILFFNDLWFGKS